jgi:hypothetical protein
MRPHVIVMSGVIAALVGSALGGCDDEPSALSLIGSGCLLNSECDEGLVCVFERCHIECNDSSDCPVDDEGEPLRCVIGERPEHVCQLPDESTCSYHSECPGLQICGPDGRCRDQCQNDRDCVSGQVCVAEGACADLDEIDDQGELENTTPPDDQTGFPCAYDSQCVGLAAEQGFDDIELVCLDGGCNIECYLDVDCEPGFRCQPAPDDILVPGNCIALTCIPGRQVGCECFGDGAPGTQVCLPDGSAFDTCIRNSDGMPCGIQ